MAHAHQGYYSEIEDNSLDTLGYREVFAALDECLSIPPLLPSILQCSDGHQYLSTGVDKNMLEVRSGAGSSRASITCHREYLSTAFHPMR